MKRMLLISALLLSVFGASGQHVHGDNRHSDRHEIHRKDNRDHSRHHHDGIHKDDHFRDHDHRLAWDDHHMRVEVLCVRDRQELWNGCHVRVNQFGVSVLDRRNHRIVKGEEVILLASGDYKVRNGGFWRVYTDRGDRLGNVWGDSVELLHGGLYRCLRAGNLHYYDLDGVERRDFR